MNQDKQQFDAIVVFPFGSKVDPLSANWRIASRAAILALEHGVPLVAHEGVPIKTVLGKLRPKSRTLIPAIKLIEGKTICDTANSFYSFAGWETWKNILVVAMPVIGERCIRDIKRVSGEGRFDLHLETMQNGTRKEEWFSALDKHFLASHPIACCLWELVLYAVPWSVYRKFATSKK